MHACLYHHHHQDLHDLHYDFMPSVSSTLISIPFVPLSRLLDHFRTITKSQRSMETRKKRRPDVSTREEDKKTAASLKEEKNTFKNEHTHTDTKRPPQNISIPFSFFEWRIAKKFSNNNQPATNALIKLHAFRLPTKKNMIPDKKKRGTKIYDRRRRRRKAKKKRKKSSTRSINAAKKMPKCT